MGRRKEHLGEERRDACKKCEELFFLICKSQTLPELYWYGCGWMRGESVRKLMPEAETRELMEKMNSLAGSVLAPHYKGYGRVEMQKDGD